MSEHRLGHSVLAQDSRSNVTQEVCNMGPSVDWQWHSKKSNLCHFIWTSSVHYKYFHYFEISKNSAFWNI